MASILNSKVHVVRLLVSIVSIAMVTSAVSAQSRSGSSSLAAQYQPQLTSALKAVAEGGDLETSRVAMSELFDDIIARAEPSELELFRDTAAAARILHLVSFAEPAEQADLMTFLLSHLEFAQALVFAINFDDDEPRGVFALLNRLREKHTQAVDAYPHLAAALCLVHDEPLSRRINENFVKAPDPIALFEYYIKNDGRTAFSMKQMPVELLMYVVDSTASIEEMEWALSKFRSKKDVGDLFHAIEYDHAHLDGAPKKVTVHGFSLPNILRYGGVCADQAYFACAVGKSIGIPTAYTVGAGGGSAHAWIGFLCSDRQRAWWDFDSGRYEEYQGVRGVVEDPQTRVGRADSTINLLAAYAIAPELERWASIAMTDAAKRLLEAESGKTAVPFRTTEGGQPLVRGATKDDALAMLESALRTCPGNAEAWFMVGKLARVDRLTLKEKQYWANVLHKLCGKAYPDFYLAVLAPMIDTVDDVRERNTMWNAAFETFKKRHDLAAAVRMRQANLWREHGDLAMAGKCCEDVITRYANAGPFVLGAVMMAEELLLEMNRRERIVPLYEKTWSLTEKPDFKARQFRTQSNWYKVGMMYARVLETAGQGEKAKQVREALDRP